MLRWIFVVGGLLIMMGNTTALKRCSTISGWKTKFRKLTFCA
jgi:hypothetical protein